MWYTIMKDFNCKAASTWSSLDERREMASTQTMERKCTDETAEPHSGEKDEVQKDVFLLQSKAVMYV